MLRTLVQLPRTVWLLAFVSFFNDTASELVYPLVPIYLASVLMAGPRALGIVEGIAEATGAVLKLFAGVWSDRTRSTKPWVVGGYALAGLARPLFAFAASWPVVLALRFTDRLGKGLRSSPRDALLARAIAPGQRGIAFGFHRAMDNLGGVLGPLLASALLAAGVPLQQVFLWAALGGVGAVAGAAMVREEKVEATAPRASFQWNWSALPRVYRRYLIALALFTLGNSSNMFLLLRARELGVPESQVPLLWALVAFTASVFSTPLSALSDRLGRKTLIVTGWLAYALFYLTMNAVNLGLATLLWPLFAFYGLFMALTEGAEKALVADLAPRETLGTAYGWFNLISGLMLLPASLIFGFIWDQRGPEMAFGFSAACAGGAAVLLLVTVRGDAR